MRLAYSATYIPEAGIYRVENPNGGPRLSFRLDSGVRLLEIQDGDFVYAFKDLNKNGKLDPYEDWRLSPEERARDLAARLTVEQMAGIMLYPVGEPGDDSGDVGEKELMQILRRHIRFLHGNRSNKKNAVKFGNNIQFLAEKNDPNGIPMNQASDPRNTVAGGRFVMFDNQDLSPWPGNLGLAATFDPEHVLKHGQIVSKEYRAMCITTALSPQVDLATEPRWSRFAGTFGEGSRLAGDMAVAYVHGFQSTWDGIGKDARDLGWGKDSVVTMIKHFPGDGAAEGGREAHNNFGKYNVYPGYNLAEHASVFAAALDIPDKGPIDNGYLPISLQYGEYYADPSVCRPRAIGVDPDEELQWIRAGGAPGTSRTYAGKTVTASNRHELDLILDTRKAIGDIPMAVYLSLSNPMCFYEFEDQADAILIGFSVSQDAALEILAGRREPKGLLPCQMPANMETVERQLEDVPFDMDCHVDSQGNAYDYAYGLDWTGVIADWRTEKYGRDAYQNQTSRAE